MGWIVRQRNRVVQIPDTTTEGSDRDTISDCNTHCAYEQHYTSALLQPPRGRRNTQCISGSGVDVYLYGESEGNVGVPWTNCLS